MAITENQVIDALSTVDEPEIRLPITALDMVHEINVVDGGRVSITISAKVEGDPVAQELAESVRAAVERAGAIEAHVHVVWMTDEDRALLKARLQVGDALHGKRR